MPLLTSVDDSPTLRFVLAAASAIFVSLLCLALVGYCVGHWLNAAPDFLPAEKPLEVRLVALEPPAPPVVDADLPHETGPAATPNPVKLANTRPHITTPTAKPRSAAAKPMGPSPVQPEPGTAIAAEARPATIAHATDQSAEAAPQKESAPAQSTGDSNAHIIAQPLPDLPDDLREDAYQAIALARFTIHTDGTVDVDLVKPTPNPRLNQLLLEALHRWRFFPAMHDGHPVETRQDIRVHFNVN